jgi:DNA-binding IclR family transcriptional regulator
MATPQILSVARAFRILSSFIGTRDRLTPKEIAERVNMNYKTVHRFLLTLEEFGAVTRIGRSEFTLGVFLIDLGNKVSLNRNLWSAATAELDALVDEFHECAQVAIIHNGDAMGVAHLSADRPHAAGIRIGQRLPLHCTAEGKVLAAGMDNDKLQSIAKILRLEQKTVNTIVTRPAFLKEISQVRLQGFALSEEEWVGGLRSVAVPIYSRPGKVLAAISLSGPAVRMTQSVVKSAQGRLVECADRISHSMYEKTKREPAQRESAASAAASTAPQERPGVLRYPSRRSGRADATPASNFADSEISPLPGELAL